MDGNSFDPDNFNFSVNLTHRALYHLDFLMSVDQYPELRDPKVLRKSAYRYEKYWLPLAADQGTTISAPLDIEWIWHCHMLSPKAYISDCQKLVKKVVNHRLFEVETYKKNVEESRCIWDKRYNSTHEPFYLKHEHDNVPHDFKSQLSYDVVAAAMRQGEFYYHVSLPHYTDEKYLESGLLRYKKFLYLKQQYPDDFAVPFYDIDLIWHTHQLHPEAYQADLVKCIGSVLNHDDTVTDRREGSKLHNAEKKTKQNWKRCFNESIASFGTMYRGDNLKGVLHEIKANEIPKNCTPRFVSVIIDRLTVHFQRERRLSSIKMKLTKDRGRWRKSAYLSRGFLSCFTFENVVTWKKKEILNFQFDTKYDDKFDISLYEVVCPCFCGTSFEYIGMDLYDFARDVERADWKTQPEPNFKIERSLSDGETKITMTGRFKAEKTTIRFDFEEGQYKAEAVDVEELTSRGVVSHKRQTKNKTAVCQVAKHRYDMEVLKLPELK